MSTLILTIPVKHLNVGDFIFINKSFHPYEVYRVHPSDIYGFIEVWVGQDSSFMSYLFKDEWTVEILGPTVTRELVAVKGISKMPDERGDLRTIVELTDGRKVENAELTDDFIRIFNDQIAKNSVTFKTESDLKHSAEAIIFVDATGYCEIVRIWVRNERRSVSPGFEWSERLIASQPDHRYTYIIAKSDVQSNFYYGRYLDGRLVYCYLGNNAPFVLDDRDWIVRMDM